MAETTTAILIGDPATLTRLERQLAMLPAPPVILGWVIAPAAAAAADDADRPVLGTLDELEAIIARRRPAVALVSLPAVMHGLVASIRTRLRRLGIPDRFMPTLEDQLEGIGPRTYLEIDHAALLDRPPRELAGVSVRELLGGRRVLITGAGGSIGSELARIVAGCGPEHLGLMDRSENALFEIDRQIARRFPDVAREALLHDVVDASRTLAQCRRLSPEIVIHAAAHKHVGMMESHPGAAVDNNLFGTKSIADAADATGVERFVMISTDKAVNPTSIMGATKRLAEQYVQDMGRRSSTAFSMVRFGNVLGSAGSVLAIWSKQIADGGPLTVTDAGMTRYFMTIPEAAALVLESATLVSPDSPHGEVFLLDMGDPVPIVAMAERFIRMHGLTPSRDVATPGDSGAMPIVFTGARPGEKLHEELAFDAEALQPTRHPAIKIWRMPAPQDLPEILDVLAPSTRTADPDRLADLIRSLVPESTASWAA